MTFQTLDSARDIPRPSAFPDARCSIQLNCTRSSKVLDKARWHKRFCILYNITRENVTQVFFEYFKDSSCSKLRGRVDLEHCDRIINNANCCMPNTFSLRTMFEGSQRDYYFAAESQEVMMQWVKALVTLIGMVDTTGRSV
ncbi:unnamed protein product [Protopolystoma xenopodis]|uniref:PH domain-containing protein n=1 Tax=Protopolystoma xenopodis TaxID=117903 RepID=A0A3S5A668_9PLAT|nr:unnamed protein product [Protopolystoma xenopodis]